MTYTMLALLAAAIVLLIDLFGLRTRLVTRLDFWIAYAIIVFFQALSNGMLTSTQTVQYDGDAIIGVGNEPGGSPPLFGEGRFFYAPVEDLVFGFSFVLLTLSLWIYWGRRGIQREPQAGPPRWQSGSVPGPN